MTVIPTFQNILIRASAGTGKTYQLSNRYLGLVAHGEPVDAILASTFTRKAAGEILNRILLRIAEAADADKKRAELSAAIGLELTKKHCAEMLRRMTENMHRIRVHTLDGYFNHLATCFPYEIGLFPGWRIIDDAEDEIFVRDAIRQVLSKDPDNAVQIMRGLSPGKTLRSVHRQILDLLREMYEKTLGVSEEAWKKVEKIPLPRVLSDPELAGILEKLEHENQNSPPKDARAVKAVEKLLAAAQDDDWQCLIAMSLVGKALEADKTSSPLTYYNKELPPEMASAITHLAFHASGVLLRQYVAQTYATHTLLREFHEAYDRLKQEAKVVRFADITRRLAAFVSEETYPSVMWRMDAGVNHLLLDEFQDTSPDQWNILKPLGKRCTAENHDRRTFFCVGDMKQAIYAWRGGKAAIFNAVTSALAGIHESPLDTSFRSSPVIMDCVNRVFEKMEDAIHADYHPAWVRWIENYNPHQTARTDYPGYWEIRAGADPEEESETDEDDSAGLTPKMDAVLKFTAREVKKLYEKTRGNISVGILMRRRMPVVRMIAHLRKLGVPASEEIGNPLTNSQAVRLILSFLKLADHPDDEVSRFHVMNSPLRQRVESEEWRVELDSEQIHSSLFTLHSSLSLMSLREKLLTEGYGMVIEELAEFLKPFSSESDIRRLEQLVKQAAVYDARKTLRPSDFVRYVELTPVADPTDANIRVMTIHGAKGLQFDAVFLPDMDFLLAGGQTPNFVVGYPQRDETAPPKLVTRYIPESLRTLLSPEFQEAFAQDKLQRVEEGLSTVYVALTRAVHALYIIVPPAVPKNPAPQRSASAAKILTNVLAETQNAPPGELLACGGDETWWEQGSGVRGQGSEETPVSSLQPPASQSVQPLSPVPTASTTPSAEHYIPLQKVEEIKPILFAPGRKFGRGLRRRTPSQAEERTTIDLEKTMHFRASSATRGTVLHAWLEKITWLEYCSPADDELYQIARQNGLDEDMIHRSLQEFHNAIKNERIRAVLSWEKYLPQARQRILQRGILSPEQIPISATPVDETKTYRWKVYCEKELAVRTEKEFLLGTIDRLVLLWGGSEVLWAECFDYKTSKRLPPEILEEKVEKHRLQLLDYREMLHRHYRLPKEQITAHLIFPMMGVVREV